MSVNQSNSPQLPRKKRIHKRWGVGGDKSWLFVLWYERSFLNLNYAACYLGCLQDPSQLIAHLSSCLFHTVYKIQLKLKRKKKGKKRRERKITFPTKTFLFMKTTQFPPPISQVWEVKERALSVMGTPSPCFLFIPSRIPSFRTMEGHAGQNT
jgi:hypothetical protein